MRYLLIAAILFVASISYADDSYVVNKSHILYQIKSENIRAFIEPGTILKKINIPKTDRYKRRLRVITPGGLEGEISRRGYDNLTSIKTPIGYLKRPLTIRNEQFESGDTFLVTIIDDDDGLRYDVAYPEPYLSLSDNRYYVRKQTQSMTEKEFDYNFNLIKPGPVDKKFPVWVRTNKTPVQWGCRKSKKEVSIVEVGAGAKVSAGGGFFNFFEADGYVNNDNKKTITYEKNLSDEHHNHKITYWKLKSSPKSSDSILDLALEKLSPCDGTKRLEYNYLIHFPKANDINPIYINRDWVNNKLLASGGPSPIKLTSLDDYRAFKAAFQDFKFYCDRNGYDMNTAIFQYVMMITANISIEYGS